MEIATSGTFEVAQSGIYFIPPPDYKEPAWIMFLDHRTGARKRVVPVEGDPTCGGLAVSPDEHLILHVALDYPRSDLMLVERFR